MTPYIILGAVLGLPLLLGLLFRVSTSHLFFSLMAGELLGRYFGDDVGIIVNSFARSHLAADYAEVALIVLPLVLTAVFLKGTLSRGKLVFHFIPLVVTGIVLAAFMLPELPASAQSHVRSIEAGSQLLNTSTVIIGGVVFLQLVALWLLNQPHERRKKHRK